MITRDHHYRVCPVCNKRKRIPGAGPDTRLTCSLQCTETWQRRIVANGRPSRYR